MKTFKYIFDLQDKITNKLMKISNVSQKVYSNLNGMNSRYMKSNDKIGMSIVDINQKLDMLRRKRNISVSKKEIRAANEEIRKLEHKLTKLENLPPDGFTGRLRKLQKLTGGFATAAIGAFGGFKLFESITGIAKLGMDMEQTEVSFSTMLGSMDKAKEMIAGLDKFANATPFENDVLYENSKLLLNFGMAGEKVIPTLKMLGDVSGGNKQKLDSLSLAYAQVQSAGKLTGQDLLQMINAGFNPLNEIAKKTGKSMNELKEAMSKGQISAQMVEGAFKSATSKGGRFYQMMEKQSKTAAGKLSTLMGKLKQKGIAIGKALLPAVNWLIDAGLKLIDTVSAIYNWYKKYSDIINVVVGGIMTFIAAYNAYNVALYAVRVATLAWSAAQSVLNTIMALNPVFLIIAGIATLIAAITYVIMKTDGWAKQWQRFKAMFVSVLDMIGASFKSMWLKASNQFDNFIENITLGWKKTQNALGIISDKEFDKERKRVEIARKERKTAIDENRKDYFAAQEKFKANAKWELKWKSGKENSFASAKNKVAKVLGINKSSTLSGVGSNTVISKDQSDRIAGSITSGGKKQTNINIKVEKLIDGMTIMAQDIKEGASEAAEIVQNELLRVLNAANSMS